MDHTHWYSGSEILVGSGILRIWHSGDGTRFVPGWPHASQMSYRPSDWNFFTDIFPLAASGSLPDSAQMWPINHGNMCGTICGAKDWSRSSHMQGKPPTPRLFWSLSLYASLSHNLWAFSRQTNLTLGNFPLVFKTAFCSLLGTNRHSISKRT